MVDGMISDSWYRGYCKLRIVWHLYGCNTKAKFLHCILNFMFAVLYIHLKM